MNREENIMHMDTSWLDIIITITKLLPSTPRTCVDKSVEPIPRSGSGGGYYMYTVEANNDCGVNFLPYIRTHVY